MTKLKENKENALKTLLVFLIYFSYSYIIQTVLNMVGVTNSVLGMFVSDVCFFLFVAFLYQKDIKEDFKRFIRHYKTSKKIKIILIWFLVLFGVNILGGMITEFLVPSTLLSDDNTVAIYNLSKISMGYTLFKTTFFSIVAEELVFKKSIRDVISDSTMFIIISSIIYGLVNIAYSNLSVVTITDFIQCFLFSLVLSYVYVKYEDNIVVVMLIKFVYTLIPLTLMLLGV